jgi:hypothetical protein
MFFSVFPDHGTYRRHHQIKSKQLIPDGVKVGSNFLNKKGARNEQVHGMNFNSR